MAVITFSRVSGWRNGDGPLRCTATGPNSRTGDASTREGAVAVHEVEQRVNDSRSHQIVFPMVVGVIFLAMLIAGAMFG